VLIYLFVIYQLLKFTGLCSHYIPVRYTNL